MPTPLADVIDVGPGRGAGQHTEPQPVDAREITRVTAIGVGAIAIAIAAWLASIRILSWVVIVIAAFMALMAAGTLYDYAREARKRRSSS